MHCFLDHYPRWSLQILAAPIRLHETVSFSDLVVSFHMRVLFYKCFEAIVERLQHSGQSNNTSQTPGDVSPKARLRKQRHSQRCQSPNKAGQQNVESWLAESLRSSCRWVKDLRRSCCHRQRDIFWGENVLTLLSFTTPAVQADGEQLIPVCSGSSSACQELRATPTGKVETIWPRTTPAERLCHEYMGKSFSLSAGAVV